jgi:hypothetical protein
MLGGWHAAPLTPERPVHQAAPMMWTDPRSLAALPYGFTIREVLLRHRLAEHFTSFTSVSSLSVPHHGGRFTVVEASATARVITFSLAVGRVEESAPITGLVEMLRRRQPSRNALSPNAAALLDRIDARRERLRQEHGTVPDSGTTIRELRDREA